MSADDDHTRDADSPRDYEVGYGKPPKRTQFQPGRSGNPKGKQKGQRSHKETVRAVFNEKIKVETSTGSKQMPRLEAMMRTTMALALKGNIRAIEHLSKLARDYGLQDEVADAMSMAAMNALSDEDRAILAQYRNADHD